MAGMAPRNRRPRAGSWRCRPSAWPSGWHPTLSKVDLLIIQIDGLPIGNDLVLVTALGIDGNGDRHPLGLVERATENTAVVQALIDNLIERGSTDGLSAVHRRRPSAATPRSSGASFIRPAT
jgi:hypothetical protein